VKLPENATLLRFIPLKFCCCCASFFFSYALMHANHLMFDAKRLLDSVTMIIRNHETSVL
jgi:hypothetical protein